MACKGVIERNNSVKTKVLKYSSRRGALKAIIKDRTIALSERMAAQFKLDSLPKSSSYVRVRRRCFVTGRGRGCYRKFGLSRIKFREFAADGLLPGVKKASW